MVTQRVHLQRSVYLRCHNATPQDADDDPELAHTLIDFDQFGVMSEIDSINDKTMQNGYHSKNVTCEMLYVIGF